MSSVDLAGPLAELALRETLRAVRGARSTVERRLHDPVEVDSREAAIEVADAVTEVRRLYPREVVEVEVRMRYEEEA